MAAMKWMRIVGVSAVVLLRLICSSAALQHSGFSPMETHGSAQSSRRALLVGAGAAAAGLSATTMIPEHAMAEGLAARLAKKDPAALKNSVFNVPPGYQVYPEFMRGTWRVESSFSGYIFPSEKIPKQRLTQDFAVPGFQKCSIAATADVGKENVSYEMTIDPQSGIEDRVRTLSSQIDGYLGYKAVQEVLYDPKSNPNRLSIDFIDYKTRNAERIELFCNARESEQYTRDSDGATIFVCSEYIRQVTFSGGPDVGVVRQVGGNYAHYWTWKLVDGTHLAGNLLTACYLDPQDSLFFEEPSKPVAIYSHALKAERVE